MRPTSRKLSIDLRGVEGTFWVWQDIGAAWLGWLPPRKRAPFGLNRRTYEVSDALIMNRSAQENNGVPGDINCVLECHVNKN